MNNTPRPHAELIKQWADDDSLEIETRPKGHRDITEWGVTSTPAWIEEFEYRIKLKTVTKSLYVHIGELKTYSCAWLTPDEVPEGWLKVEGSEREVEVWS